MKTLLIVVGKTVGKLYEAAVSDYVGRIGHYMPFELVVVPEPRSTKSLSQAQQKSAEGEQLLRLIQPHDTVVLLDEHGQELRSQELARWLERKRTTARRLVLVVGGPYGFSEAVYERASEQLSLSRLTLSHQMVRLVLVEQLYRACTIIKGEPYHHE